MSGIEQDVKICDPGGPLSSDHAGAPGVLSQRGGSLDGVAPLTTLIVDDEAPVAEELARYLSRRGLPTRTAGSANEALDQIAAHPDIGTIVADIRMPGTSGLDFAAQLRQQKINSDDPAIVMMTAHGTMDDAIVALRLGAVEFLRKPFRMTELEQVVRQAQLRTMRARNSQGAGRPDGTPIQQARIDPLDGLWDAEPDTGLQRYPVVLNALAVLDSAPSSQLACLVLCQAGGPISAAEKGLDHLPPEDGCSVELMRELAERLRRAGNVGDLICQADTNQLMILRTNATVESCKRWVEHVRGALRAPYRRNDGQSIDPGVHFGVAHSSLLSGESLREAAQAALRASFEDAGHGQVRWYELPNSPVFGPKAAGIPGSQIDYSADSLEFRFQPIVSITDRTLAGFEILSREKADGLGSVGVGDLVADAERTGSTRELDEYVVTQALFRLRDWQMQFGFKGYISINICPASLEDGRFSAFLGRTARKYAVSADRICLEIIESSITNISVIDELSSLRDQGFKIAIDDFGWGFSSLSRLLELPADIVKFDRKFLHQDGDSSELRSFLLLARDLVKSCHITTLAEGVESGLDWSLVRDVGFDYAQGYWLGVPLAENEVAQLLQES